MNTSLILALAIPWVLWGVLMALLIVAQRSWINILVLPVGLTLLVLAIATLSSYNSALWFSVLLHLAALVYFLGSYIAFMLKERGRKH